MSEGIPDREKYERPIGRDVYFWPEFQALAERLLIDLSEPIIDITIHVPCDEIVVITRKTKAMDGQSER